MPRYIDADKLLKKLFPIGMVADGNYGINAKSVKKAIEDMLEDECEDLPVLVDGKEVGTWDGIVHIFCCGRAKQIILTANGDESDRFLSLDDCLDEIECDKENEYAIVIIEEGLHGDIYKFGQYSNREWHKCGSTCGFY